MNDALVTPVVAGVAGIISVAMLIIASRKVRYLDNPQIIPLMGVMGAFIFVAQMINFAIPGTGSSGHIIGAVLLSVILGEWAGFITISSVLIIQCLLFADGGLLALGCNIFNMGVLPCLIAYPALFRPFVNFPASFTRLTTYSIITCVVSLLLGAIAVTIETTLSDITALPIDKFLMFMLPIHFIIGICEGIATALALFYIQKAQPALLDSKREHSSSQFGVGVLILTLVIGIVAGYIASPLPDGLEWSIINTYGDEISAPINDISPLPDYSHSLSGLLGSIAIIAIIYVLGKIINRNP